jgi:hypothetical protein
MKQIYFIASRKIVKYYNSDQLINSAITQHLVITICFIPLTLIKLRIITACKNTINKRYLNNVIKLLSL